MVRMSSEIKSNFKTPSTLHLFYFYFYINRAVIQYLYILLVEYHSCYPHCIRSVEGLLQGCRAEIRTRACRTASRCATIWAAPHPNWATPHPVWATPHPIWATPHPIWATPHPIWATPHPAWATPHPIWATPHPIWATPHPILRRAMAGMSPVSEECRL
jgi:hypothetical protein